jgi:hypothetical protein
MAKVTRAGAVLRKMRADMLRQADRVKLEQLTGALRTARARRKKALQATVRSCKGWRQHAAARIKERRREELARLQVEAEQLRQQARNRCQSRRETIRTAGGRVVARKTALLKEERELQAQLKRLAKDASLKAARHKASAKERRAESDDYVRGNLPPELVGVFDRVKGKITGSARRTRTEAFLEWVQEHPEDVLRHQEHAADRDVAALVAEHHATAARLRKGKRHYVELADAVPF